MSTRSPNPDWITYVPRRVYDAARRLEAACVRCRYPSLIAGAELRSDCQVGASTLKKSN